jgi:hypothetical protein
MDSLYDSMGEKFGMDHGIQSLQSIMNGMLNRLDDILPDELQDAPQDRDWPLIHIYLKVDPVLAQLYKQYCDARAKLDQLHRARGADDPMAEVAADMKDSAHAAVETRLLELKESAETQGQVARRRQAIRAAENSLDAFDQMMIFMIGLRLMLKSSQKRQDIGVMLMRQFRMAS